MVLPFVSQALIVCFQGQYDDYVPGIAVVVAVVEEPHALPGGKNSCYRILRVVEY